MDSSLFPGNDWTIICLYLISAYKLTVPSLPFTDPAKIRCILPKSFPECSGESGPCSPEHPHRARGSTSCYWFSVAELNTPGSHRLLCIWELVLWKLTFENNIIESHEAEKQATALAIFFLNTLFPFSLFYLFVSSQHFILSLNQTASWIANSLCCFSASTDLQQVINP